MMRRLAAAGVVLGMLVAAAAIIILPDEEPFGEILIGMPDDTGGLIVHYLLESGEMPEIHAIADIEGFEIRDCCVARSQWALSTDELDAAVMCPDAAELLVKRDPRFTIVGPCLVNSDVVVARDDRATAVGVGQNRHYQVEIAEQVFGPLTSTAPVVTSGLSFAYEKGTFDAVVLDALRARQLEGVRYPSAPQSGDRVTYVLVVSKEFEGRAEYATFKQQFDLAAERLNETSVLTKAVESYTGIALSRKEVGEWKRLGIRFVSTTPGPAG